MSMSISPIRLLTGSSNPELAKCVTKRVGYPTGSEGLASTKFSNGETFVTIKDSVRDADVYIMQTASEPVNDMLMELLIAISACRTASARRITAVLPCFPYARQDRKDRSRAPITAKLVANMLEVAGCDHVITMDLHASQIQGFFNIPVDNSQLYAESTMVEYIKQNFDLKDVIIVSPDAGGAKRAGSHRDKLGVDFVIIHKEREVANQVSRMFLLGDVRGKTAIIVDDIADTCGTLAMAAEKLKESGASQCVACITHGVLSGPAVDRISQSSLDSLVVSNTMPLPEHARQNPKIHQVDISYPIAESIRRTHNGES